MTLWKLFLLIVPLLDAVGDVDSYALGAKVSAAYVARHGHGKKIVESGGDMLTVWQSLASVSCCSVATPGAHLPTRQCSDHWH